MFITMTIQYLAPVLSIHLHAYGYSPEQIGMAYGIPALLYASTVPFIYILTARMKKRGIILIGFVMICLGMAMIGGSDSLFEFQKQPVFIFLGLCIIGLSAGMISIPVLPEMLECVEEDEELAKKHDMEHVENMISGLFISFQSIGEAIGPVVSSFLTDSFGFQISQEVYCGILLVFIMMYFLLAGNFHMFTSPSAQLVSEDDRDEEKQKMLTTVHEEKESSIWNREVHGPPKTDDLEYIEEMQKRKAILNKWKSRK